MLTVTAEEMATRIPDLLARVAAGEEISILHRGCAVARLISDRVRLRERLGVAVANGRVELGNDELQDIPQPARLGGIPASVMVIEDRQGRDDQLAGIR